MRYSISSSIHVTLLASKIILRIVTECDVLYIIMTVRLVLIHSLVNTERRLHRNKFIETQEYVFLRKKEPPQKPLRPLYGATKGLRLGYR